MSNTTIGKRVLAIRKAKGISLRKLAHDCGIARQMIYRIQSGGGCTTETLCKLAEALGVTTDELLGCGEAKESAAEAAAEDEDSEDDEVKGAA